MKKKTRVLWLSLLTCYGNTHSFLNYPYLEQFLDEFEFIYHPVLEGEYSLEDIVNKEIGCDILLLEGALSHELTKADASAVSLIQKYARIVKKIVTVGTCATFGGIFKEDSKTDVFGLHFKEQKRLKIFDDLFSKTVSVTGCPIHPEVLVNTLYAVKKEIPLLLDNYLRPKEYFSYMIHNGCTRNEYFEYKIDNHRFGQLEGCMFYEHGCRGPYTHGSCNKVLWNEISSKTRAGVPCFGCTEAEFPMKDLFATKKNMGIPEQLPAGIPKRTYIAFAGVAKAFKIERFQKKLFDD